MTQPGEGLTKIMLHMSFAERVYGFTLTRVVKSCGEVDSQFGGSLEVVTDMGADARCAGPAPDRSLSERRHHREGRLRAFAFVEGWSCSARSGTVAFYSGVGGSCANDGPNREAIMCEPDFVPQPGFDPFLYDQRSDLCELVQS